MIVQVDACSRRARARLIVCRCVRRAAHCVADYMIVQVDVCMLIVCADGLNVCRLIVCVPDCMCMVIVCAPDCMCMQADCVCAWLCVQADYVCRPGVLLCVCSVCVCVADYNYICAG